MGRIAPSLLPAPLQEGRGDAVPAVSLNLSVLPGETSSSLAPRLRQRRRQEHAGIACNQATMRREQRGEKEVSLQALADRSVCCVRVGRGHGILPAWHRLGRTGNRIASIGNTPPDILPLNSAPSSQSLRKGGRKQGKKLKKTMEAHKLLVSVCLPNMYTDFDPTDALFLVSFGVCLGASP